MIVRFFPVSEQTVAPRRPARTRPIGRDAGPVPGDYKVTISSPTSNLPTPAKGQGLPDATAGVIYGMYTAMVYLLSVPGGWIADRFLGQQRAVLYGGALIMAGHVSLALPAHATFYLDLSLVALGTGLLKPNVSTLVGSLYRPGDTRRDAGFSLFYMGINLGAFIGPLIAGYLAQRVDWHIGFASAGIGALLLLMARNIDLSVMAILGIILLIGIVKKNGIMLVDFALQT